MNRKPNALWILLILAALLLSAASAEETPGLPPYGGKLTQEDTFLKEEHGWGFDKISEDQFYQYRADRPEWKAPSNWYASYEIRLTSGEPIRKCTVEQLSGPSKMSGLSYNKRSGRIFVNMAKTAKAEAGDYAFLVTAEGTTKYAREVITLHLQPQPEELTPLRVRPLLILNTLDKAADIRAQVTLSEPEIGSGYFEVYCPRIRYYTGSHGRGDVTDKAGDSFVLEYEEGGQAFTPLSEGTYKAAVDWQIGRVVRQEQKLDIIVSSTLTYDDFALTLTPEATEAAAGKQVKIKAEFADPAEVNAKAKNNGIVWSVATADGGDASALASVGKTGALSVKKIESAADVVVTAASEKVPEQTAQVTIHLTPLTKTLTAVSDAETLYTVPGKDTAKITMTAEPADAVPKAVFKSSSEKVATVDDQGAVTAVGPGKATITVSAKDGSQKSASVKLEVVAPVTGLSIESKSASVPAGKTLTLKAVTEPEKPTDKTVAWSVSQADEGMAEYISVSKTGAVSVKKGCPAGKFTVCAEAAGAMEGAPVRAEIVLAVE